MELSQELKRIADELGILYFRFNESDMNQAISDTDVQGLQLMNWLNEPLVTYQASGVFIATYPLEIEVLELAEADDNTPDSDQIVDRCRRTAEKLVSKLLAVDEILIADGQTFSIDSLTTIKKYDDVFTGVLIQISVSYNAIC